MTERDWQKMIEKAELTEQENRVFNGLVDLTTQTFIKRYGGKEFIATLSDKEFEKYLVDEMMHHVQTHEIFFNLICKVGDHKQFNNAMSILVQMYKEA